jgi:hypothetical protein
MAESGMDPSTLLETLLELADRTRLEVRVLSAAAGQADFSPTGSAACRVGDRIWVVLAPDDPPLHQAGVLAETLVRFRSDFLEECFLAPGVRAFVEQIRGEAGVFVDPPER